MEITKTIQSKSEIIEALQNSFEEIAQFISSTPDELFNQKKDGKWSIAENFDHLIKSNKPVASVLKKNKLFFLMFGLSLEKSMDFETLKSNYFLKLSQGGQATGTYIPDSNPAFNKEELLKNWKMIGEKFSKRLDRWTERDIDRFRLPHPLLGKLTFREMLFFSIFHNLHHLRTMKAIQ